MLELILDMLGPIFYTICIIMLAFDVKELKTKTARQERNICLLEGALGQLQDKQ